MVRVVFAGGGTGGHVFPAIAIAERLAAAGEVDMIFVGTKSKIEARVVPELGYKFRSIWIGGFSRRLKPSNFLLPAKIMVSIFQSLRLLLAFKPQVVVGTGGYVSGPVCAAAVFTRTPILLQEHNSYPGAMTRMFAPFAREVHIAFESSRKYFVRKTPFGHPPNLFVTGSPLRKMTKVSRNDGIRFFGLEDSKKTIFVTGGSLGAVRVNDAVSNVVDDLTKHDCQLIWQTGSLDFAKVSEIGDRYPGKIRVLEFIEQIDYAYSAADVAVCRGGATTVAEIVYFSLPALIVPYPYAPANHQVENARALVEAGGAIMVQESEPIEKFKGELLGLIEDSSRVSVMRDRLKSLQHRDAAEVIAASVLKLAGAHE